MPEFNVYTAERSTGTDTNGKYVSTLAMSQSSNYIRLLTCVFANTFYNVTETLGNSFTIQTADDNTGTNEEQWTVTLANGYYDYSQLVLALKAGFEGLSGWTGTISFTLGESSQLMTIAVTGKYIKVIGRNTLGLSPNDDLLNLMLGFTPQSLDSEDWALSQTGNSIVNVQRVKKVIVLTDMINPRSYTTAKQYFTDGSYSSGRITNVLCELPIATIPFGQYGIYQPTGSLFKQVLPNTINNFSLVIVDDKLRPISSNGSPFSFTFETQMDMGPN